MKGISVEKLFELVCWIGCVRESASLCGFVIGANPEFLIDYLLVLMTGLAEKNSWLLLVYNEYMIRV